MFLSQEDPEEILNGGLPSKIEGEDESERKRESEKKIDSSPEQKKDSWFQLVKEGQRMGMSEIKMKAKAMLQRKHEAEMYKSRILKKKLFELGTTKHEDADQDENTGKAVYGTSIPGFRGMPSDNWEPPIDVESTVLEAPPSER